jgi:hypothetical protein
MLESDHIKPPTARKQGSHHKHSKAQPFDDAISTVAAYPLGRFSRNRVVTALQI